MRIAELGVGENVPGEVLAENDAARADHGYFDHETLLCTLEEHYRTFEPILYCPPPPPMQIVGRNHLAAGLATRLDSPLLLRKRWQTGVSVRRPDMARQMGQRRWMRVIGLGLLLLAAGVALRPGHLAAADAVLDAKRRAAAQLLHDGKPAEAIALLEEVTKATDTAYADHLLMARASEKLGQTSDALRHYRRV